MGSRVWAFGVRASGAVRSLSMRLLPQPPAAATLLHTRASPSGLLCTALTSRRRTDASTHCALPSPPARASRAQKDCMAPRRELEVQAAWHQQARPAAAGGGGGATSGGACCGREDIASSRALPARQTQTLALHLNSTPKLLNRCTARGWQRWRWRLAALRSGAAATPPPHYRT